MKKIILTIAIGLAVGILGLTFLRSETKVQASSVEANNFVFGDACKDVKFMVKNEHSKNGDIEIRGVKYFNKANGKWQTEDIPNHVINQGSTYTTSGDDLKDSEG